MSALDLTHALALPGWMSEDELAFLAARAQTCQRVIEVGSWLGRSTRALADHCPGTVWAVDDWRGDPGVPEDPINRVMADMGGPGAARHLFTVALMDHLTGGRVKLLTLPSVEAATQLGGEFGRGFDLIFLDGSHDYASVRADLLAYRPLVRDGGLLCGHDRGWTGVAQAVTEVLGGWRPGPGTLWLAPEEAG